MRVLFITSRFPESLRRGDEQRAYQHLRALSQRHAITLLTFAPDAADSPLYADVHSFCERVIVVKKNRAGMLLRASCALAGRVPLQAAMNNAPAFQTALKALLDTSAFEVVHVQLARLGEILPHLGDRPCVLDLIDALSLNMARRAQFDRGPMRFLARIEATRLLPYERALCTRVAAACLSSARDRDAIGRDLPRLHIVENGVDLDAFSYTARVPDAKQIVFVGNLGYFPNIDAATWFACEVLPLLRARVPDVIFNMVGARPAASLHRLAQTLPGVTLIGPVASVQPSLATAAVAIAPMRAGSGQQIKILEAMACGTPVVATSMAAAGLDAIAGRDLLVADGAQAFADAIAQLLHDREYAAQLAKNARALVEQRYSWTQSALMLERHWHKVAAGSHRVSDAR